MYFSVVIPSASGSYKRPFPLRFVTGVPTLKSQDFHTLRQFHPRCNHRRNVWRGIQLHEAPFHTVLFIRLSVASSWAQIPYLVPCS
jgi:hypothetical protein